MLLLLLLLKVATMDPPPAAGAGTPANPVDHGLSMLWGLIQQYGFLMIFLAIATFVAKGKFEEYQTKNAVKKLNSTLRKAL